MKTTGKPWIMIYLGMIYYCSTHVMIIAYIHMHTHTHTHLSLSIYIYTFIHTHMIAITVMIPATDMVILLDLTTPAGSCIFWSYTIHSLRTMGVKQCHKPPMTGNGLYPSVLLSIWRTWHMIFFMIAHDCFSHITGMTYDYRQNSSRDLAPQLPILAPGLCQSQIARLQIWGEGPKDQKLKWKALRPLAPLNHTIIPSP